MIIKGEMQKIAVNPEAGKLFHDGSILVITILQLVEIF